jgi:hypothetical protein
MVSDGGLREIHEAESDDGQSPGSSLRSR